MLNREDGECFFRYRREDKDQKRRIDDSGISLGKLRGDGVNLFMQGLR